MLLSSTVPGRIFFSSGRQKHRVWSSKKKKICDRKGSEDKGPHWSLGNEIKNAQSNHLTPLSRARGSSTRVETARKWQNGRGKGNRKIAGAREDGNERRSARSEFLFPDQSRSLILAHRKFFSFYSLSSVRIFDCPRSLSGGERVPLLMLSLIVEGQCLTSNIKGLWNWTWQKY